MNTTSLLCKADDSCLLVIDIQSRLTAAMPGKVLDRLNRPDEATVMYRRSREVAGR